MAQEYSPVYSYTSTTIRNRVWKIGIAVIISFSIPIVIYGSFIRSPRDIATAVNLRPQRPNSAATTSILQANQGLEDTPLTSPSGKYHFKLEDSGELTLLDRSRNKIIFSSNTGMNLNVSWHPVLRLDGVFELSWDHVSEIPKHGVAWSSNLLLGCHPIQNMGLSTLERRQPVLELFDSGLLQIRANGEILCNISRPVEDKGRLAISYSGFLRTYLNTCGSHMEHIISQWTGSGGVDVHVFVYDEEIYDDTDFQGESITYDTVHNHLKACFGNHLKTFAFISPSTTAQNSAALPQDVINRCYGPARIDRILSQYHSLYQTGQQIRKYMLRNAIQYDYILRFRPDIIVKHAPQLEAVDHGKVVNIRATYDLMYWGLQHDGSMHTGFTDIAAYGRASAMWTYFNIHTGLQSMLSAQPMWDWSDVLDIDHDRKDLGDHNRCDAEGVLGYWLVLNGLELVTDWRWTMGILRKSGHISQGFFTCQPWLTANWMCPEETVWS